MRLFRAALPIKPSWTDDDRARAKTLLVHKIAKETQTSIDIVARKVTFEDWNTGFLSELVATFREAR